MGIMYSISLENVPTISLSEFMKSRKENNGSVGHMPSFQMVEPRTNTTEPGSINSHKTSAKDNSNSSSNEQFPTQLSDYAKAEKLYSQLLQQSWLDQLKS